jgi:adenylylsulfate kinase
MKPGLAGPFQRISREGGLMNFCLWITGLPGSGKTTIAKEVEELLFKEGVSTVDLAMDELRKIMTPEPKYTDEEREIAYRALVLLAQFLLEHSRKSVIIDATGNRRHFRNLARERISEFAEVYVKCAVEVCQARESSRDNPLVERNIYRKARAGRLQGGLPGVTAPYEEPTAPEIEVASDALTPVEAAQEIVSYVRSRWLS